VDPSVPPSAPVLKFEAGSVEFEASLLDTDKAAQKVSADLLKFG
jgi:hypothetical protein